MADPPASFKEIEHTADLAVEVTAPGLASLFAVSGEALFSLIADPQLVEERDEISVSAIGDGSEELLHAWLCELLAQFNLHGFVAKSYVVDHLAAGRVAGRIRGETLDLARHGFRTEIKGVTYHDFRVWQEQGTWHARVIFDV